MTRRVLVSDKLPELRSGNPEIDRWVEQHLQAFISQTFEQIRWLVGAEGEWEAAISGSGTAGTYEIATQFSRFNRSGDLVDLWFLIVLDNPITGGGVGDLQITGLPYTKAVDHTVAGTIHMSGVNWTAGANLCLGFSASDESSTLQIFEMNDNAAQALLAIGALAADDILVGHIRYITSDP